MKKALLAIGLAAVIILSLISWYVLPEKVAVRIGRDGETSGSMPKLTAIAVPILMCGIGGWIAYKTDGADRRKGGALLCIGIAIMLFTLMIN